MVKNKQKQNRSIFCIYSKHTVFFSIMMIKLTFLKGILTFDFFQLVNLKFNIDNNPLAIYFAWSWWLYKKLIYFYFKHVVCSWSRIQDIGMEWFKLQLLYKPFRNDWICRINGWLKLAFLYVPYFKTILISKTVLGLQNRKNISEYKEMMKFWISILKQ